MTVTLRDIPSFNNVEEKNIWCADAAAVGAQPMYPLYLLSVNIDGLEERIDSEILRQHSCSLSSVHRVDGRSKSKCMSFALSITQSARGIDPSKFQR